MALMFSPHNTSDQALVSVSFNFGKSLAQERPTELVSLMANFLLQSAFEPQQPTSSAKRHCLCNLGDLLTATQVCQKWRESILNDARLWTEIEFTAQRARDVDAFTRVLGLSKRTTPTYWSRLWAHSCRRGRFRSALGRLVAVRQSGSQDPARTLR
ncbi:hypothetical protein CPB85DRAFT_101231 [Mucidula mucida]|nr:hypothetical protein CPB85DRAFT_101231 [Mucidula mucida]